MTASIVDIGVSKDNTGYYVIHRWTCSICQMNGRKHSEEHIRGWKIQEQIMEHLFNAHESTFLGSSVTFIYTYKEPDGTAKDHHKPRSLAGETPG